MKTHDPVELAIELLRKGYAQKTVAKRTGLWLKSVGDIALKHNVGRRAGQTRAKVEQQFFKRTEADAIMSFLRENE